MKIRSITYFCNPGWPIQPEQMRLAARFIKAARSAFQSANFEVQTTRLASVPFPTLLGEIQVGKVTRLAQELELTSQEEGFDYLSLGPAIPEYPDSYAVIPEVLAITQNTFLAGLMTTNGGGISLKAIHACAEVICRTARLTPDGFANLRFAALANVPPGAPFFPAAYHNGDSPSFAIATEAADLAVDAFRAASSLEVARTHLVEAIEIQASKLSHISLELEAQYGQRFAGIDFTLAPFPDGSRSIGTALQASGIPPLGMHGTLAAVALLAESVDRARFPRAGFSSIFLPVLEDAVLAQSAAHGTLGVKDLLLYSTVCGTGLDTIPLPGDTSPGQLAPLLLDLAVLAQRLDKPLTARLMPIPGKIVGDPTDFDFPYFANSRVMAINSEPLSGWLADGTTFELRPWRGRG